MAKITITNVSKEVAEDLKNISRNEGIPLSSILKPKLREVRDSYPKDMRERRNNKD